MNPNEDKIRVLFVDDSRATQAFVVNCFQGTAYQIDSAMDAQEALDAIAALGDDGYDLILLDWELPDAKGPELLQVLSQKARGIPVVMVSSHNQLADIAKVLDLGAKEYIMKPFTREILLQKIESLSH